LFDDLLPVEVRELPEDLAVLDQLLADARLLVKVGAGRQGRPLTASLTEQNKLSHREHPDRSLVDRSGYRPSLRP
jgi:hypothetical protein